MPTTYVRFPNGETYEDRGNGLWEDAISRGDCEVLKGKAGKTALLDYRRSQLLKWIKPGTTVKIVQTHRSSSGMSARFVSLIAITDTDGHPMVMDITSWVAELCGMRLSIRIARSRWAAVGTQNRSRSFTTWAARCGRTGHRSRMARVTASPIRTVAMR